MQLPAPLRPQSYNDYIVPQQTRDQASKSNQVPAKTARKETQIQVSNKQKIQHKSSTNAARQW